MRYPTTRVIDRPAIGPLELPRSIAREGTVTLTTHRWSVQLAAEFGHADITPELAKLVRQSGLRDGVLTVQMLGSTGAITTIEYESGALSLSGMH